ncbi:MAG TPA: branched-chain amino acid ABC transporter permease [Spirochaetales bacterium]|nr:branched-chain amino acid ABC transporter permease [Spirochaetales bacterium]HPS14339.1 branched-chain amino acid ABC transporter permease [Spirochaetales bacterium]
MKVHTILTEIKKSLTVAIWFMILFFPIMVMKVSVSRGVAEIQFRWNLLLPIGVAGFVLSFIWRHALVWNESHGNAKKGDGATVNSSSLTRRPSSISANPFSRSVGALLLLMFAVAFPFLFGMYHTNVMITAFIYVILGLGLNIVVGLGGLLNLGYAAFFGVGAYTYGLIWKYVGPSFVAAGFDPGWLFWISLPVAGVVAMLFGVLLSLPVLRLRGDYLAIITLAFGEIFHMVMQNSSDLTGGATGISLIPRPWFLGRKLAPGDAATYIYFIALVVVIITIFVVRRIEDSRVGRALEAMREDQIACQSMGVDLVKNKLITFALGAFWAGLAGVLMAAQTTYINPDSFTLSESMIMLMSVVVGGTGSIPGVIAGAMILKLLPEYFRMLAQYRMLIYGIAMVLIIIFKSDGLIPRKRKQYTFEAKETAK